MAEIYTSARIKLFDELIAGGNDVLNGGLWLFEPEQMRFRHGESIAELKIPYHVGAEDEARMVEAILALVSLLQKRFESGPGKDVVQGRTQVDTPLIITPPLKDRTYRTDLFVADSFEKELAMDILRTTPYVDSAILLAWLGPDGQGRALINWLRKIFDKVLQEEARAGGGEKTSYFTLLAVLNTIRKKKERLKGIRIKGLSYERLDFTVGITLFNTFRGAVRQLLAGLKETGAYYYNPQVDMLLNSAILPKYFLTITSNLLSMGLNPYGIDQKTYDILKPLIIKPDETSGSVSELIGKTADRVRRDSDAARAVKEQYRIMLFREGALKYLTEFDLPDTAALTRLYEIYNEDRLIANCLKDPASMTDLIDYLDGVKKMVKKDRHRAGTVMEFQQFLSSFMKKKGGITGFLTGGRKEVSEAAGPVLEALYARELDASFEGFVDLAMACLTDKRGELKGSELVNEFKMGRIYRFSTDTRPVIKALDVKEEGQLFVDMKDFTRRTSKVKEIAMADFMKEYFYAPILKAASRYGGGAGGLTEDERAIRLTNLPGDAAIFSGGVEKLVALARDIQKVIRNNRKQLEKRLPPKKDEEILEKVHRRFEAKRAALKQKRLDLTASLGPNMAGQESRLIALGEEESRLESIYKDELQAAISCEIEAGLFVSYGAKAETMIVDPGEGIQGPATVSIGEKINEASRGTFRHPMVRANLEILLSEERKRRRKEDLRYPFDVYIHTNYSLRMPPELEKAFGKLVANRKLSNAEALAGLITENYLKDFKKVIAGEPFSSLRLITSITDIYNKGQALSHEAIDAYIRETKGIKRFFKKAVKAEDLDDSIIETFFFPSKDLEFIFGTNITKGTPEIEAFHKSGELIFRGFESASPSTVYELLDTEGEFYRLLIEHHYTEWLEEAKGQGEFL